MVSEILRTYVAGLLSPTSLLGVLLVIGVLLLWKNKIKWAKLSLSIGVFLFVVMSMAPLRTVLYSLTEVESAPLPQDYEYVVVLGGKIFPNDAHPLSSQIAPSLLSRLSYGVALVKARPGSILVLTGNGAREEREAILMEKFAKDMGVPRERIFLEKESMNTSEHPRFLAPILKGKKFLIVTSAYHMNRALANFKKYGLEGMAAPTDFANKKKVGIDIESFIMRGENFSALDRWTTETYSMIKSFLALKF